MTAAHHEMNDAAVVRTIERRIAQRIEHRRDRKTLGREEIPEPVGAKRIDHLERSARPAVTELHRLVDRHDLVGHFRHERRRVAERMCEHPAREAPGRTRVLGQRSKTVALPRRCGLDRCSRHRAGLSRQQLHDLPCIGATTVEATGPLVAGVSTADESAHQRDAARHALKRVSGRKCRRQARRDIEHEIKADEIVEPEQAGLGDPHRPGHDRIRLFDGHPLRHGLDQAGLERVDPDPVGEETRGVTAVHHSLAEFSVAELRQLLDHLGPRVRPADQLEQPHVAHRVEEMGDAEIAPHGGRHAFGQQGERQRGRVGRDDGARPANSIERIVEVALHLDAFDHRLHDPVAVAGAMQMVLDVADRYSRDMIRMHEWRRTVRAHALERSPGDRVAVRRRTGDVEQFDIDAGIGEMPGNARTHRSGPNHCNSSKFH